MEIALKRTGNFYIDNGLIALFQNLEKYFNYDYEELLTPNERYSEKIPLKRALLNTKRMFSLGKK